MDIKVGQIWSETKPNFSRPTGFKVTSIVALQRSRPTIMVHLLEVKTDRHAVVTFRTGDSYPNWKLIENVP